MLLYFFLRVFFEQRKRKEKKKVKDEMEEGRKRESVNVSQWASLRVDRKSTPP
jgi:hypothetical protein